MDALRSFTGGSTFSSLPIFSYHPHYTTLETQKELIWEIARHLLICGAMILLVLLFLLANLWAAVSIVLALAVTTVELVGLLALSGMKVFPASSMPTLVYLTLSLGFFTHSMQGYMRCQGIKSYRASKTMQKIGGVICDYIFVLFFAVLLLAGARTPSLFIIFQSLALLATLGLMNGLMVWPIFLTYLGPNTSFASEITLSHVESNPITEFRSVSGGTVAAAPANRAGGQEMLPFTAPAVGEFQPRPVKPVQGIEMQSSAMAPHQPSMHDYNTESVIETKRNWNPHDPANNQQQQQQQLQQLVNRTPQKPAGKWM